MGDSQMMLPWTILRKKSIKTELSSQNYVDPAYSRNKIWNIFGLHGDPWGAWQRPAGRTAGRTRDPQIHNKRQPSVVIIIVNLIEVWILYRTAFWKRKKWAIWNMFFFEIFRSWPRICLIPQGFWRAWRRLKTEIVSFIEGLPTLYRRT